MDGKNLLVYSEIKIFEHFSDCFFFTLSEDMAERGSDFTFIRSQRNENKLTYNGFVHLVCYMKNENKNLLEMYTKRL